MFERVHIASVVLGLAPFALYMLVLGFADGALHIYRLCDLVACSYSLFMHCDMSVIFVYNTIALMAVI